MARTHYFYSRLKVKDLDSLVGNLQTKFDTMIKDLFSDDELQKYEPLLDQMAAVIVQPILRELSFDDFYADPKLEIEQREFFLQCQSCLCFDQLPYFQSNPFQVSFLLQVLERLEQVLIDQGGTTLLEFKTSYLEVLKQFKTIDSLISNVPKPLEVKTSKPVNPIDFVIRDVYVEIDRLVNSNRLHFAAEQMESQSEKLQKLFSVMRTEKFDANTLLKKSTLIPKDFGDYLERLKFFLKKIS